MVTAIATEEMIKRGILPRIHFGERGALGLLPPVLGREYSSNVLTMLRSDKNKITIEDIESEQDMDSLCLHIPMMDRDDALKTGKRYLERGYKNEVVRTNGYFVKLHNTIINNDVDRILTTYERYIEELTSEQNDGVEIDDRYIPNSMYEFLLNFYPLLQERYEIDPRLITPATSVRMLGNIVVRDNVLFKRLAVKERYGLYIFTGPMGSGKTCTAVANAFFDYLDGANIIANFDIYFEEYFQDTMGWSKEDLRRLGFGSVRKFENMIELDDFNDLDMTDPESLWFSTIIIDEGEGLNSRDSQTGTTKYITDFIQKQRHFHNKVYICQVRFDDLDTRIRYNYKQKYSCRFLGKDRGGLPVSAVTLFDHDDPFNKKYLRVIVPDFSQLYNTHQQFRRDIVKRKGISKDLLMLKEERKRIAENATKEEDEA
jgi:hypothetical protein